MTTPAELLAHANDFLQRATPDTRGLWPRAAALLAGAAGVGTGARRVLAGHRPDAGQLPHNRAVASPDRIHD
jgi:hypothetical protein